jgi:membrane protein implicated in regulation of membrane protease activity
MRLDIRLPIGLLFALVGAILVVFGLFSDKAIYARSLGVNINLWWGLALLAFGGVMLLLSWRSARAHHESKPGP